MSLLAALSPHGDNQSPKINKQSPQKTNKNVPSPGNPLKPPSPIPPNTKNPPKGSRPHNNSHQQHPLHGDTWPSSTSGFRPSDIQLEFSENVCFGIKASACTLMSDICSMGSASMQEDGKQMCASMATYCNNEVSAGNAPAMVEGNVCVRFDATKDACALIPHVCKNSEGGACSQLQKICNREK